MASRRTAIKPEQMERMQKARKEGVAVRAYLAALSGSPAVEQSEDVRKQRLEALDKKIAEASILDAIKLRQQRYNVENGIAERIVDLTELEQDFVAHAKGFGERNHIVHEVWVEMGVGEKILKKAGV